jgi:hypothetical protein
MANSNFVVHNGLTVGPLTVDATHGNTSTSGNIIISGTGSISLAAGNITLATGQINLPNGAVGATTADATALAIALGG